MIKIFVSALLISTLPAQASDDPPFVGTWDCEVSTFTFTGTTYDSGEGPMPIRKIEREDGAYTLSFDDDYMINLANITATDMDWFSHASGDTFHCKKVEN